MSELTRSIRISMPDHPHDFLASSNDSCSTPCVVVHGLETVRLPLSAVTDACTFASREVERFWMPRCRSVLTTTSDVFCRLNDRSMCSAVRARVALNRDLRGFPRAVRTLKTPEECEKRKRRADLQESNPKKRKTLDKNRAFSMDRCLEIPCPYERVYRLCRLRRSTNTEPSEFGRLDASIASTHEEIKERIQNIFTTDELTRAELFTGKERSRCEKFNGDHWKTRIMSEHIKALKEHTRSHTTLVPIQTFINERCVKEEGSFTSSFDLYSAYTEWHGSLLVAEGPAWGIVHFGRYLTPLLGKTSETRFVDAWVFY